MRIAFLLPVNGIAGGLFVAYRHAHHLAEQGHDVTVVFMSGDGGTSVNCYPDFALPVRLLAEVVDSDSHFDVVISGWWECYYAMFHIAAEHYIHFIQGDDRAFCRHFFGSRMAFNYPFIDRAFSESRVGLIVVARWLKEKLEQSAGVQVVYAPNGIDTSLFHPGVRPLEARGDRVRVLIEGPGRVAFKRVDMAFRVARRLPDVDVWYVSGDGAVDPAWRAGRVFRQVPMQEMPTIYASCHVLLKLSVVEGFFGPPLEMMACGGTAVVGKVSGYDEYILDGHNALAVELDDEEAAYRALRRLVDDRDLRERLSEAGVRTARELDWSRRCPLFEEALLRLTRQVSPTPRATRALYLALHHLRGRCEQVPLFQEQVNELRSRQQALESRLVELAAHLTRDNGELRQTIHHLCHQHGALEHTLLTWRPFRTWKAIRGRAARMAKAGLHALRRWGVPGRPVAGG